MSFRVFQSDKPSVSFVTKIDETTGKFASTVGGARYEDADGVIYSYTVNSEWLEASGAPEAAWHFYDFGSETYTPRDLPEDWAG